eukprot:gene44296-55086_t
MAYRDDAARSIAEGQVGEQTVIGPVLVIPYAEEIETRVSGAGDEPPRVKTSTVRRLHLVYPDELKVSGNIGTERRYRGIHQVLVYNGQYEFSGGFTLPQAAELPRGGGNTRITVVGRPYVSLPVADVRGVRTIPKINWNGALLEFGQGAQLGAWQGGMHALLPADTLAAAGAGAAPARFSFKLNLAGMERQHFVPVGRNNVVALTSNWPHPQFGGRFLPEDRAVSEAGFTATWRVPSLASNVQHLLAAQAQAQAQQGSPAAAAAAQAALVSGAAPGAAGVQPVGQLDSFSVAFVEPVNIYSQAGRGHLGWACYGGYSPWEVVVGRRKLVGLAQVRRRGGVLLVAGQGGAHQRAGPSAALLRQPGFSRPGGVLIESASLNLKNPFGLSLSKPRAALRQAQ